MRISALGGPGTGGKRGGVAREAARQALQPALALLELLPPLQAVVVGLLEEPLSAPKSNVLRLERLDELLLVELREEFQGLRIQMRVQRINVSVVSGDEVIETVDLKQILNDATSVQSRAEVVEIDSAETSMQTEQPTATPGPAPALAPLLRSNDGERTDRQ